MSILYYDKNTPGYQIAIVDGTIPIAKIVNNKIVDLERCMLGSYRTGTTNFDRFMKISNEVGALASRDKNTTNLHFGVEHLIVRINSKRNVERTISRDMITSILELSFSTINDPNYCMNIIVDKHGLKDETALERYIYFWIGGTGFESTKRTESDYYSFKNTMEPLFSYVYDIYENPIRYILNSNKSILSIAR